MGLLQLDVVPWTRLTFLRVYLNFLFIFCSHCGFKNTCLYPRSPRPATKFGLLHTHAIPDIPRPAPFPFTTYGSARCHHHTTGWFGFLVRCHYPFLAWTAGPTFPTYIYNTTTTFAIPGPLFDSTGTLPATTGGMPPANWTGYTTYGWTTLHTTHYVPAGWADFLYVQDRRLDNAGGRDDVNSGGTAPRTLPHPYHHLPRTAFFCSSRWFVSGLDGRVDSTPPDLNEYERPRFGRRLRYQNCDGTVNIRRVVRVSAGYRFTFPIPMVDLPLPRSTAYSSCFTYSFALPHFPNLLQIPHVPTVLHIVPPFY